MKTSVEIEGRIKQLRRQIQRIKREQAGKHPISRAIVDLESQIRELEWVLGGMNR